MRCESVSALLTSKSVRQASQRKRKFLFVEGLRKCVTKVLFAVFLSLGTAEHET